MMVVFAGCVSPPSSVVDAGLQLAALDASVTVDFTRDAGPVPRLFQLGVQVNGAAELVNQALPVEQRLGHLRMDLGYGVMSPATSAADAVTRLTRLGVRAQVEALRAAGAEVTLNLVETPRYLSSCASETQAEPISGWPMYSTCPPADLAGWESLISSIVTAVGPGVEWELWNEPDGIFWRGTPDQFFALYGATARAVRRADPTARIGGPTVSWPWAGTLPVSTTPGFIENFLAYCASHPIPELGLERTPVDFVVWHAFGLLAQGQINAMHDVRRWANEAGYPNAKLSVDEWNVQTEGNAPGGLSDVNHSDSEWVAAYAVSSLLAMHRGGLDRHAFSALADWSQSGGEFHGGQGLTTTSGLRKPVWNAMQLMGRLHGQLATVSTTAPLLEGVASIADDAVWVLVVNPVPDWRFGLEQFFAIDHFADAALVAEIDALPAKTKEDLLVNFTVTAAQLPVSTEARALAQHIAEKSRVLLDAKAPLNTTIALTGVPAGFTQISTYVIDSKASNSYRAWQKSGGSLSAARAAMELTKVSTTVRADSSTEQLTVMLEPDAIVAYEIKRP